MAGCLDEGTVLAFLGGTLNRTARAAAEAHVAACAACADLVTWAAADQANATGLTGGTGRPFVGQLQPGARVGRYQILGALGRGGMGEVYAAYHPDLDRRIALKVVREFGAEAPERRARLLREARAVARLSHPNVVTVHDAGTFGQRVFIAMELIEGPTIDQWLAARERSWQEVVDVFLQAARGLAAAHAAGVIHRDFKPQNVMIGKDGAVRVMDFGLARLEQEAAAEPWGAAEDDATVVIETETARGAFIGTPAYMSPEQFRGEATDARSDQFSFCVALHGALFGTPPAADPAGTEDSTVDMSKPWRSRPPRWLRDVVQRGASADRALRYGSMNEVIGALERGRMRLRRRLSTLAVAAGVLVALGGAWRIAHANRVACVVPTERIAAAWDPDDSASPRRQSIHRAFTASGRDSAETSWGRVSKVLDDYMRAWSSMYVQTCEATHLRGEQSPDVLDLRMACLQDNLDQVHALTDSLATADAEVVSRAATAAHNLTPVSRCANVQALKSAVPLPKDEKTLGEVQRLRPLVAAIATRREVGRFKQALEEALALRAQVDETGYKPLRADLLHEIGVIESSLDEHPNRAEPILLESLSLATAAGDDLTAAKATTSLAFLLGFRLGRVNEAEAWSRLGHALLDRIGSGQEAVRAWLLQDQAAVLLRDGKYQQAREVQERAVAILKKAVGETHPSFGTAQSNLSFVLTLGGDPEGGLAAANRAIRVVTAIDSEAMPLAIAYCNQADALYALGRYEQAASAYHTSLRRFEATVGSMHPERAFALHGLGMTTLAQGFPPQAISLLSQALAIRQQPAGDPALAAETQFALARAIWQSDGDRARARTLATAALNTYRATHRSESERVVHTWLSEHARSSRSTPAGVP